ncbi:hypothetical protein MO867_19450 [Microbulbifer sp. OS29]|uniref:Uncharacterized protein n=1 Tax=Microbulbifer okhotskensis TaxID=2926617 RepID=A0A9X2EQG8_9GAMM|nr:hypothetical protein [Microbulbifer okhotskensis]MCO1336512.1 hypothetical protein [Microbulbifer okhotskensis]
MALPDKALSSTVLASPFIGGSHLPVRNTTDYESGGIAIQDPSAGLNYQVWRARVLNDGSEIVLDAREVEAFTAISGSDITEVSLAFDQNMRPVIAYVEAGTAKLYWYNSSAGSQTTSTWPGIITPRLTLDDKRSTQTSTSDVIFAYLNNGHLYYRQQRDRYETEYRLQQNVDSPGLIKIGMNRQFRLQFLLKP